MTTTSQWIAGARPRTLPAAIAPVLVGGSIGWTESKHHFHFLLWLCALTVALCLQVGVNYSNDYSDGIRGTDDQRTGPVRLVGQKIAPAAQVKRAALICFALSALAGLGMVAISGYYILIPVGLSAIASAWFYTGGKRPYGYAGLGEVFVFVYFGLVAVIGTSATQTGQISLTSVLVGVACGCLSTAILVVNNLRDIPSDVTAGKRTLAVRLGDQKTRILYGALLIIPFLVTSFIAFHANNLWILLSFVGLPLALKPFQTVRRGAQGRELIPALAGTGKLLLWFGIFLGVGIILGN